MYTTNLKTNTNGACLLGDMNAFNKRSEEIGHCQRSVVIRNDYWCSTEIEVYVQI